MPRPDPSPDAPPAERPAALATVLVRALEFLEHGAAFRRDADLVQLVEVDPTLRGAVLRIVRSPLYAVADLDLPLATAIERLGPETLAESIRALAPDVEEPAPAAVESQCRQWLHGVAVAAAARWLSNQGEHDAPDEAYLAGLVHGLCHPSRDAAARAVVREFRFGPRIEEVVRLGPLYGRVPADSDLVVAGRPLDPGARRLFHVVSRADALVNSLGFGPDGAAATTAADEGEPAAVAEAVALELAHATGLLGLAPREFPELVRDLAAHEARARARWAPLPARPPVGADVVRLAAAAEAMTELRTLPSIAEILERGLEIVHQGLDFDRVLVLEREHGTPSLARVRAVACRSRLACAPPRSQAEVPVAPGGAVLRAFESARSDGTPSTDPEACAILGAPAFVAAPLRAANGTVGAVVADCFLSRRTLGAEAGAALAIAAGTLGLVLEGAALLAEGKTLRSLAERDSLTGISNRRTVLEVLRREMDRARRYGKPLSIALLDVDHFKTWNDVHGHQVGDTVLQTVAQLLSSSSREIDACGRYGGEEFLVVLPETTAEQAVVYAERLRQTVERHAADLAEIYGPTPLTVSIGITQLLARGDDADRMIQRADRALYLAKGEGRNRVVSEPPVGPARTGPDRLASDPAGQAAHAGS